MKAIPPSGNAKATSMVATASTATAPGGGLGSGIDQHLGFDISAYIQPSDMQKWWDSSPYYDAIFYVQARLVTREPSNLMRRGSQRSRHKAGA